MGDLRKTTGQVYSFSMVNFNSLFHPIITSLQESEEDLNEELTDLIVDCINKMIKYEQVFNPQNSEIFLHVLRNLAEIMP